MNELAAAAGMALLAITSVGLWTLRVALTARGRRGIGATVYAVEAVIFAVAFTNVAANLDSPVRVAGYAAGVALGTVLGLTADRRLSAGRPKSTSSSRAATPTPPSVSASSGGRQPPSLPKAHRAP